jgi:hypothetical protein
MALSRRNELTRFDARLVGAVALASAVVASFADTSPTGDPVVDAILVGVVAAVVTWLAATAPWWALGVGAGATLVVSLGGSSLVVVAAAALATAAAGWIGWTRDNLPVVRALTGALTAQAALRLAWDPFLASSLLVGASALVLISVTGLLRRHRYVRRRVYWGVGATVAIAVVAVGGMAVGGVRARGATQEGYDAMLASLDAMQSGDLSAAAASLTTAQEQLRDADAALSGALTQGARLVPGVAQNRDAVTDLVSSAADAAGRAATALSFVDLDQLAVSEGRVDLDAVADLESPLRELEIAVVALRDSVRDADSPWLVAPLADRLESIGRRADQVAHQATATAATAAVAPQLLGADGPRRYLIAFVNTAEARGQGGLMGNWSELTADDGVMRITASGRSADLQSESLRSLQLDVSDEYIARYGDYGATRAAGNSVLPKYWSNVTMPADMPTAAAPMAQMYEQATGRAIDGVFVVDPDGLAAIVDLVGTIEVESLDRELNGAELREFLLLDQYEIDEAEREDVLESLTTTAIEALLSGDLPPQVIAETLSDAALNGHITGWAGDPEVQSLFELVGMDGALPRLAPGMDGLAVVSNNAGGNKIDNFVERRIDYRPVVDQRTGEVTASLTITLTNDAPERGYSDYVLGNLAGAPRGTNRMLVEVYSPLDTVGATFDGRALDTLTSPELGYSVFRRLIDIPAGETGVLQIELAGNIGPGAYALAYRPQSLPNDDELTVDATTTAGATIFEFSGSLERRSVLDADGVQAWRPADADA